LLLPLHLSSLSYELFQTSKAIWCLHNIINTRRSFSIFQNKAEREIKYGNLFILYRFCFSFFFGHFNFVKSTVTPTGVNKCIRIVFVNFTVLPIYPIALWPWGRLSL
jgi:hypothetical protein